tara:strand:+ start:2806 stop:3375 length:570 start_codon:yes stop_codon:yes gene_type:complete
MEKNILFRAVVEVLGKPQEHVEKSIKDYVENLKKSKEFEVISEDFAKIKKQEEEELWSTFAELEIWTDKIENLTGFCFDYMPSLIEVIEPTELRINDREFSSFLNDLQAKLHQVDMLAKQMKMENDYLKRNMGSLLKNYLTVLLSKGDLTSEQLGRLTGIKEDKLADFLDQLIDSGKVKLKEGIYSLEK